MSNQGDARRGEVTWVKQSMQIQPFSSSVVILWDKQDLFDVKAFLKTSAAPYNWGDMDALASDYFNNLALVSHTGACIHVIWIPVVNKNTLGYQFRVHQTHLMRALADIAIHTCNTAGYNPMIGSVMFNNLMSSLSWWANNKIEKHVNASLTYASVEARYLDRNLNAEQITTVTDIKPIQLFYLAQNELQDRNNSLVQHDNIDWFATTYFK